MKKVNTISQALRRVKEIKGQIAVATSRMTDAACWLDDNKPSYEYGQVRNERTQLVTELVDLKDRLARANSTAMLASGMSLHKAILTMAELKAEMTVLAALRIQEGTQRELNDYDANRRPIYVEHVWHAALTNLHRDKLVADLQSAISDLNDEVESTNHRTLLPE
jgi:hypothetical protein